MSEKQTETQNTPEKKPDAAPAQTQTVTMSKTDFDALIARVEKSENEIKGLKLRTDRKEKRENPAPTQKETQKEPESKPAETKTSIENVETDKHEHPHFNKWQRFCPTCGDQNPEFKDETQCVRCGTHLGAKENLSTAENPNAPIKVCPNCGAGKDGETVHVRLLK